MSIADLLDRLDRLHLSGNQVSQILDTYAYFDDVLSILEEDPSWFWDNYRADYGAAG